MKEINTQLAAERAAKLFNSGWNCAESVFMAVYEQAGDGEAPVNLLTPLGGGLGCGKTCGALTGAIVSLGLGYGRNQPDATAKQRAYAKARDIGRSFRESFHSTDCWELTDFEENEKKKKLICTPMVCKAAELASEMLNSRAREADE